jgi:hypothetical protein
MRQIAPSGSGYLLAFNKGSHVLPYQRLLLDFQPSGLS